MFKFEKLEIWQLSLEYIDSIYDLANAFPKDEEYNLKSQIRRAVLSVSLNIAEGSTGQSDAEQSRFLGMALRSLVETIACIRIAKRRGYLSEASVKVIMTHAEVLTKRIQATRKYLSSRIRGIKEEDYEYGI